MTLAKQLLEGVEALRSKRHAQAITLLTKVADDEDLKMASDMLDIRARVCSLLAQALFAEGALVKAKQRIDEAIILNKSSEDSEASEDLKAMRASIASAIEHTTLPELNDINPLDRDEVTLQLATEQVKSGSLTTALATVDSLLERAEQLSPRVEVISRLIYTRINPSSAPTQLQKAWVRAEAADDFNLVTAVAKAARSTGTQVGTQAGPALQSNLSEKHEQ